MKKPIKQTLLSGAMILAVGLAFTSCDDILGEWDKPAAASITPEVENKATITFKVLNEFQDPDNKVVKEVTVAKLTLKSACLPNGQLVFDDQITSPASSVTVSIPNPPSGQQTYDVVAIDTEGNEWTAEGVSLTLNEGTNPDKAISLFNPVYYPLTIEITEDDTTFSIDNRGQINVHYMINGGEKVSVPSTEYYVNVSGLHAGDIIQLFNNSPATATDITYNTKIYANKKYYVYGNVMSMVDDASEGFAKDKVLTGDFALCGLFEGSSCLTFHDSRRLVLPATTLSEYCYGKMFYGCKGLTSIPEDLLPNKTLTEGCYNEMFQGCTGLTALPEGLLPAGKDGEGSLAVACYEQMFGGCEGLNTLPEKLLPATTLADKCYFSMFDGCKGLTTLPEKLLPATTLAKSCYNSMFRDCDGLTTLPEKLLPTTILKNFCYYAMFLGCDELTTLPEGLLPARKNGVGSLAEECYSAMFQNCVKLQKAPTLPATTLTTKCYVGMFLGCTSLNNVICLATNIPDTNCLEGWLKGAGTADGCERKVYVAPTNTYTNTQWQLDNSGEDGKRWAILKFAASKALNTVTTSEIGWRIGSNGIAYEPTGALPQGVSAVAMITYVSSTGHGYAIELSNAHTTSTVDWNTAKNGLNNKAAVPNCIRWELPDNTEMIGTFTDDEKGCGGASGFLAKYSATGFTAPQYNEYIWLGITHACWYISSVPEYAIAIGFSDTNHVLYALVF